MKLDNYIIIKNINDEDLAADRIFRSFLRKSYAIRILFAFFEVPSIPWKPVIAGLLSSPPNPVSTSSIFPEGLFFT